jgi:hypothetical protein
LRDIRDLVSPESGAHPTHWEWAIGFFMAEFS